MRSRYGLRSISCVLAASVAWPAFAFDSIPEDLSEWTEHGAVVVAGAPGEWDEKGYLVEPVGLHRKDGVYYLFYTSGFDGCWNAADDVSHMSLGLATSTDGVNFEKHPDNPILTPHDFVAVSAHEEGIRTASVRYLAHEGIFLGYFGVESPGGLDTCPFMGSVAQCQCDIAVNASVYAATSTDGVSWTVEGEVQGVFNGQENYVDDFRYHDGQYYVWTHRAEGGQTHHMSIGPDYMDLVPSGEIPELCWGWSQLKTFLHDDGETVTLIYDPSGSSDSCAPFEQALYFSTTSLRQPNTVTSERLVHRRPGERTNLIVKEPENGLWRWYYNKQALGNEGAIHLRTHTLIDTVPPAAPTEVTVD